MTSRVSPKFKEATSHKVTNDARVSPKFQEETSQEVTNDIASSTRHSQAMKAKTITMAPAKQTNIEAKGVLTRNKVNYTQKKTLGFMDNNDEASILA